MTHYQQHDNRFDGTGIEIHKLERQNDVSISVYRWELNNKTITYDSSNYAEHAIMKVLMMYNCDALQSWLGAGHFVKGTAGQMDAADPSPADNVVNHGLKRRAEYLIGQSPSDKIFCRTKFSTPSRNFENFVQFSRLLY